MKLLYKYAIVLLRNYFIRNEFVKIYKSSLYLIV